RVRDRHRRPRQRRGDALSGRRAQHAAFDESGAGRVRREGRAVVRDPGWRLARYRADDPRAVGSTGPRAHDRIVAADAAIVTARVGVPTARLAGAAWIASAVVAAGVALRGVAHWAWAVTLR